MQEILTHKQNHMKLTTTSEYVMQHLTHTLEDNEWVLGDVQSVCLFYASYPPSYVNSICKYSAVTHCIIYIIFNFVIQNISKMLYSP